MEVIRVKTVSRIEISICHETESRGNGKACKILSVSRSVTCDDKEVFKDEMSPVMYAVLQDPIRKLELFLLGLEESQGGKDGASDCRDTRSFFKKIRCKLLEK